MIYGVDDVGVNVQISFIADKKPTKENIEKIEKVLESTKKFKNLEAYFINVKFIKAEVVIEEEEQ